MAGKDVLILVFGAYLFCSAVVSFLVDRKSTDAYYSASGDEQIAAFWLLRSAARPYREWYLHPSESYASAIGISGAGTAARLPPSVVAEGHVLFPLHVVYLWLCGVWLRLRHPEVASSILETADAQAMLQGKNLRVLRDTVGKTALAVVVLLGVPGVFCLANVLCRLLTQAAKDRVAVAQMLLPSSGVAAHTATTEPGNKQKRGQKAHAREGENTPDTPAAATEAGSEEASPMTEQTYAALVFCAAATLLLAGLVPLLALDIMTWQPWSLVGSLLVWAVFFVLQDEMQLHRGEATADGADAAFDVTTPVVEEGAVVFYALKKEPSAAPLVGYTLIATVMSLTIPAALYVTPVLFMWALTSCWQHGYRRVLVKVKPSLHSTNADAFTRVGYSCYLDKLHVNACFCYAFMTSVLVVLGLTTPWWWQQQPLLTLMDLFASPPLPQPANASSHGAPSRVTASPPGRSLSGAWEMQPECLSGPVPYHTCALPTANVWQLSEWFGVPWTQAARRLTRFFAPTDAFAEGESGRWMEFVSILLAVLANAASIVALTFYRVRKPPLSFETPVRYAAERAAHRADQQAYWEERRRARRGGGGGTSPAAAEQKRTRVVTCLSREEYIVKQAVLLSWMLPLAAASGTLLLPRKGPATGVLAGFSAAFVATLYVVIALFRRLQPLAFSPLTPQEDDRATAGAAAAPSSSTAATTAAAAAPEGSGGDGKAGGVDGSALEQQDGDELSPPAASRWSTSATAPSLAHAADLTAVLMCALATLLSTGPLSRLLIPPVERQYGMGVAAACMMHSLSRVRRWVSRDGTSSVMFILGGASSLLLIALLAAQSIEQVRVTSAAASSRLTAFTNKFGDMFMYSRETALLAFVYQCGVACVLYMCCVVYATLRVGRLVVEPEEVSLVPIEAELSFFNKPAQNKKQQ